MRYLSNFLKTLGPGLMFAGASVGVSHIVQSTRAGANYGFALLWVVVLVNILKFPFFEYGPRYVIATGDNLLKGYQRVGWWAFYLFLTLSLLTMFIIQAAVTMVTAGLFANLFSWSGSVVSLSGWILGGCFLILVFGHYALLDKSMKVMVLILSLTTVIAFCAALGHGSLAQPHLMKPFTWDLAGLSFLIAFMGWMPSPIEISVWHSFWSAERQKQTGYNPTLKEALLDFHLGYWGTAILAILFLSLGALVMYATGETFASSAVKFTGQVVSLYTKALGQWSYPIIVLAASITMFSTTISCLDAFCRVIKESFAIIVPHQRKHIEKVYIGWMVVLVLGAILIIGRFAQSMKMLVDVATILSFLSAPIFAYINFHTVTDKHVPKESQPSKALQIFSWIGLVFLIAFSCVFIVWRFFIS